MKQLQTLFLLLLSISISLHGKDGLFDQSKSGIGTIYGQVLSEEQPQGLEFANVALYLAENKTPIQVFTTKEGGHFAFSNLAFGKYHLEVTFLGLEKYRTDLLLLNKQNSTIEMETIFLEVDKETLEEVQVTGEKVSEQMDLVTKRFNVGQNVNNAGGTALDALRNIPSLNVDLDGQIQLRGSNNVKVLVNGRPSALIGSGGELRLDQIPVAAIEAIEVITNPSAKYEADGKAGVINIIMKKSTQLGFNYNINFLAGNEDKWNTGIGMNYRTNKWNWRLGYQYKRELNHATKILTRQSIFADTTNYLEEKSFVDKLKIGHSFNFGIDWNPIKRMEVFTNFTINPHAGQKTSKYYYDLFNEHHDYDSNSIRTTQDNEAMSGLQGEIGVNHRFARRRGMTLNTVYSVDIGTKSDSVVSGENYFFGEDLIEEKEAKNRRDQLITTQLVKSDFTWPFSKKTKLETGGSYSIRSLNNDFQYKDRVGSVWVFKPNRSNDLFYEEKIGGLYVMGTSKIKKWDFNAGLRMEMTYMSIELAEGKESYPNDYANLFPSGHIAYEVFPKGKGKIMVSYSRRIKRPSYRRLNPFVSYNDSKNIRRGNPLLKPAVTDSWELGWQSQWKKGGISPAIYYRYTKDQVGYYTHLLADGIRELTFVNIDHATSKGAELVGNYRPIKWLRFSGSVSYYRQEKDGNNIGNETVNEGNILLARLMATISPLKPMSIQLSSFYHSGFVGLVGNGEPMKNIDFGMTYKVFKNRGKLIFRVSDIFNTRGFAFHVNTPDIKMDFSRRRESRIFWAGFTWELKQDKKKRRNSKKGHSGKGMEF